MDPSDRPPNFMGATIIDVDIDAANNMNSDLPTWLRDVLDRALSASGIRTKKKSASDDAINSLRELNLSDISDANCPICYDPYDTRKEKEYTKNEKDENSDTGEAFLSMNNKAIEQNKAICDNLQEMYNINNVQSLDYGQQFKDPSLFFPVDEGAIANSRFPARNLSTLENARRDQILPGYSDGEKVEENQKKKDEETSHIPVKMPSCDHVFGKSCIIEWLKGNVSCPLCREEVEALKETDPKIAKRDNIRDNSFYNFNSNQEQVVDHILNHLTDVFNPFRRPFNPSITPLTDSNMHQDWATPYYTIDGSSRRSLTSREPHLVLPRRFPFSEGHSNTPFMPLRHRVRDMRRETRRDNASETNNETNGDERDTSADDPSQRIASPNSRQEDHSQESNVDHHVSSSFHLPSSDNRESLPASNGTGGPERTVRSRAANGRSHPYVRPPSVD